MEFKDKVMQFTEQIMSAPEYVAFKTITNVVDKSVQLKEQVEEFFKEQANIHECKRQGKKLSITPEEMNERFKKLIETKEIESYFNERQKFHIFMLEVHELIDETISNCLEIK